MPFTEDYKLNGQTRVSDAEGREHEGLLLAKRITEIPSNNQLRVVWALGTGGNQVAAYVGFGPRGLSAASTGWMVQKFTYDANDNPTLRQIAYGIFNNYASLTYA